MYRSYSLDKDVCNIKEFPIRELLLRTLLVFRTERSLVLMLCMKQRARIYFRDFFMRSQSKSLTRVTQCSIFRSSERVDWDIRRE